MTAHIMETPHLNIHGIDLGPVAAPPVFFDVAKLNANAGYTGDPEIAGVLIDFQEVANAADREKLARARELVGHGFCLIWKAA